MLALNKFIVFCVWDLLQKRKCGTGSHPSSVKVLTVIDITSCIVGSRGASQLGGIF